jgi:flagellar hook-basal body protein
MVRSLYSGVAGMKVHQSRMDVIGNNISNVNTYGFKASRATFADLYYQTLASATRASASEGGTNPSQIGYGVQFGGVDLLMERAAFTSTDRGMDVAIAGEGFFQVQDKEGNVFYTRAGILSIDTAGNLVDGNGNFVLGISGSSIGKNVDNMKIQLSVPAVTPTAASASEIINGRKFTITATNKTKDGNITFKFVADDTLPGGLKAKADITISGITIRLNASETFYSLSELNTEINRAIVQANGGKAHPAGDFIITTEPANVFPGKAAVNGWIETTPVIEGFTYDIFGGMSFSGLGSAFSGIGSLTFRATHDPGADGIPGNNDDIWHITATDSSGTVYSGDLTDATGATLRLQNGTVDNDYIELSVPSLDTVNTESTGYTYTPVTGISVNRNANLQGGLKIRSVSIPFNADGAVQIKGLYTPDNAATTDVNEEKITITATVDGKITYTGTVYPSTVAQIIRLDNPSGDYILLDCPSFSTLRDHLLPDLVNGVAITTETPGLVITAHKSTPFIGTGLTGLEIVSNDFSTQPGKMTLTGTDLTLGILGGLQFVTTSSGFTAPNDLATVQFDSEYVAGDSSTTPPTVEGWKITATIGNEVYSGSVTVNMTSPGSFLLKNDAGEYIEMSHPGITEMNASIGIDADSTPVPGVSKLTPPSGIITITSAQKSNALGLSSKDITLAGGTEGGVQSVSDLTNIAISPDGTITATHSVHGTIELGRIILATFENPQGLEQAGNSYFVRSANSGAPKLAVPGESGTGTLVTSALEMSNVDLSKEFTEMITTQRGFQANSRVITVSDTLLEELINLKR